MTLKVAVIAEGNASGAVKAMDQTSAAVTKAARDTSAAAVAAARAEQTKAIATLAAARATGTATAAQLEALRADRNRATASLEAARASHAQVVSAQAAAAAARSEAAALQTHTTALNVNAAAARANGFAQRNLAFQMNDVVVSLISGQAFWMVAAQQGAQIAQTYGPGEGGATRAFKEMGGMVTTAVTRMWPLIAATAVFSIGVAGMRHEIEAASGVTVSWGDVALGVFQTIGDGLYGLVRPAVDAVKGWFETNWNTIVQLTKDMVNNNVRGFNVMVAMIVAGVRMIPPAFRLSAENAAKAFLGPFQALVDKVAEGVNAIIDGLNRLGGKFEPIKAPTLSVDFGGAAAQEEIAAIQEELKKRLGEINGTDYAGEFFKNVMAHAVDNYNGRQDETKKKSSISDYAREIASIRERTAALDIERRSIGLSTFEATRMQKVFELENAARKDSIGLTAARVAEIQKEATAHAAAAAALENTKFIYDSLKEAWSGFFSEFRSNVREGQTALEAFANAGKSALDRLSDRFADFAADQAFNFVMRMVLGGATGNFIGGTPGAPPLQLGYQVGVAHTGLRAGAAPSTSRYVPPSIFANAPRLHSGLAADEFPAILQKGEEVVPRGGGRGGGFTYNDNRSFSFAGDVDEARLMRILAEDREARRRELPQQVRYLMANPRRESVPQ